MFHRRFILWSLIPIIAIFHLFLPVKSFSGDHLAENQDIYVIPVAGEVDPGLAAFIERSLAEVVASRQGTAPITVILELDTFGGRVDSALKIVDVLMDSPDLETIAYVKSKAISAGALIALSCRRLFMKSGTTIGDCAPISLGSEGPKMMGEKFQSPLRAKFRSIAKKNGYPEALAESMVSIDMAVYRISKNGTTTYITDKAYQDLTDDEKNAIGTKTTVVAKGELLTMDDVEAHNLGFSGPSVTGIEELLSSVSSGPFTVHRVVETWSENMVRFLGPLTPILLMIGLGALYTEIKAPGFGVPGIIGIICLAVVFWGQYLVGLANYTELLIILAGLLLLGFEIFVIPGFGISGIAGLLLITAGFFLTLQDFVIPNPEFPWEKELLVYHGLQVTGAFLASLMLALFCLRYVLPNISSARRGPYLTTTLQDSRATATEIANIRPGDQGYAKTFLRPSGKMQIGNDLYDVTADGEYIEKGSELIVQKIIGNRIIVGIKK